ncbi:hypothetical protein [Marivita sp. GX14005]|uniref:hypothetical protein n=1 Tax=Marivita sp. GX14005 TaxID=2942276 RepID=UPI0020199B64|nr:hypothetical protein [Marivita sp. GX14005]MCL3882671.1 hypothetical protein [Marivita sp. GX14005]
MPAKPKAMMKTLKMHVPIETLRRIDEARIVAGYTTRTEYMIDSALSETPVHLREIALRIGQLGLICNTILIGDEEVGTATLQGEDARRAVRKIIKTCDAVRSALEG